MFVVAPASRLRRGVRRFALTLCALILGAGFTPALPPSTVDHRPAPVAVAAEPTRHSTVDVASALVEEPEYPQAAAPVAQVAAQPRVLVGRAVGAVAGRAPPSTSV